MLNTTMPSIVKSDKIYRGKTYSQWIPEWCNWFYMVDPDQYNNEPWNDVKFLRSFPSPEKIAKLDPNQKIQYEGSAMYRNLPNVMIGSDRIVMYDDQAIFFPVMLGIWIANDPNNISDEYGMMERWVKEQNSHSDDPPMPYQFTINGKTIINSEDITSYKISSNATFSLRIPAADYGRSLNDFVFEPSAPGWYQAYCQGYFFMVEGFKPQEESYFVFSMARGAPYAAGEYYASFVYEIKVLPRSLKPRSSQSGNFPERILHSITNDFTSRKEKKEIGEIEFNYLSSIIRDCKETQNNFVQNSINNRAEAEFQSVGRFLINSLKNRVRMAKARNPKIKDIIPKIEEYEKTVMTIQEGKEKLTPPKWSGKSPKTGIEGIIEQIRLFEEEIQTEMQQGTPPKK
jgi:hypothetical protein